MQPRANRTVICSVVFMDIAEYSRKPVAEQIQLKERLNELLSTALADVAANDRIILDTGDGAAISFLGDPEDALFVGLSLREALAAPRPPETPELPMRIGINLGPVKLITDLNGQPNIIGDGINVAQRVMSFALPGQILVSRSYYEVVSCMSDDYSRLFNYEGARTDKHVREHEVYGVSSTQAGLKRISASVHQRSGNGRGLATQVVVDRLAQTASHVQENLRRKPRLSTALAVILILAFSTLLRIALIAQPVPAAAPGAPDMLAPMQIPGAAASAPGPRGLEIALPPASQTPPALAVTREPATAAIAPPPATKKEIAAPTPAVAEAAPKPAVGEAAAPPAGKRSFWPWGSAPGEPTKPEAAEAPRQHAALAPAKLEFAIAPWGEVFVDGVRTGVTPPLHDTVVEPGRHTIEVRNADFPPHIVIVNAKSGQEIRIKHKFQ